MPKAAEDRTNAQANYTTAKPQSVHAIPNHLPQESRGERGGGVSYETKITKILYGTWSSWLQEGMSVNRVIWT